MANKVDVFENLIEKIDKALEEEEFEGVWKDPEKEYNFQIITECANRLVSLEAVDRAVANDLPDSPSADVTIWFKCPALFSKYDGAIKYFRLAVATADYITVLDDAQGKTIIRFIVEDYWHPDLSKE